MTYWLIIMREENYRYTVENGIYGLPKGSSWLKDRIKPGDRLVIYIGKSNCSEFCQSFVAVLEVTSEWRPSPGPTWPDEVNMKEIRYPWVVDVKPIAVGRVNFNDIKDELPNDLSKRIDIKAYRRELPSNVGELIEERLRNSSNIVEHGTESKNEVIDDCKLIKGIYGDDLINSVKKILENTHALLIIGPPGTGKTTLARCLAHELNAELLEVTVHGWFSRMDLIGGYVLQGGSTTWRDGIVLRAVKSGRKTLILLDEINRGEPERFLAELFTALSKPDKKLSVPSINNEEAYLSYPLDNIYIVATANTADVGVLGGLGFALQRRFKAVRLKADGNYVENALNVFGYGEFKEEIKRLWGALEKCLKDKIILEDYTNYMPGWAYFVDYARLRRSGFSDDEAFNAIFNIYVERFGCNAGGSTNESQPRQ